MDTFESILQQLDLSPDQLREENITSLAEARARLGDLASIPDLDSETARKLASHVRLSAISSDVGLNQKLVNANIGSITELSAANMNELAERIGGEIDIPKLEPIQHRAKVLREVARARVSEEKIANALQRQNIDGQEKLDPSLSALSPAAYLVDLIWFIQQCFTEFPDLDAFERRFYRSFKDLPISRETVEQQVYQIELANEVLERFVTDTWQETIRNLPQPNRTSLDSIISTIGYAEAYLSMLSKTCIGSRFSPECAQYRRKLEQSGISHLSIIAAFNQAYPDRSLLKKFSVSGEDLEDFLTDRNHVYSSFSNAGLKYPNSSILRTLVDAYLSELGTDIKELSQAFDAVQNPQPDFRDLDRVLRKFSSTRAQFLQQIISLGITEDNLKVGLTTEQKERITDEFRSVLTRAGFPVGQQNTILEELISAIGNIPSPPNRRLIDQLLGRLFLDKANKQEHEAVLQSILLLNPLIENIDKLPDLIRISRTKGQYPNVPRSEDFAGDQKKYQAALEEYRTGLAQAESAINWVKESTLEAIRENLIYIALKVASDKKDAKVLGNYLHTDLSASLAIKTTRVANIIEALQSFIWSFQLAQEAIQLNQKLTREDFKSCLDWLQSYSLWHSAQMIRLYPEQFLLPKVRRNMTQGFKELVEALGKEVSLQSVQKATDDYQWSFQHSLSQITDSCLLKDSLILKGIDCHKKEHLTTLSVLNSDGEWSGWITLESIKQGSETTFKNSASYLVQWNNLIYLFSIDGADTLRYISLSLDSEGFKFCNEGSFSYKDPNDKGFVGNVGFIPDGEELYVYFYENGHLKSYWLNLKDGLGREILGIDIPENPPVKTFIGAIGGHHYILFGETDVKPLVFEFEKPPTYPWTFKTYQLEILSLPESPIQYTRPVSSLTGTIRDDNIYLFWDLRKAYTHFPHAIRSESRLCQFSPGDPQGALSQSIDLKIVDSLYFNSIQSIHWFQEKYVLIPEKYTTNAYILKLNTQGNWQVESLVFSSWAFSQFAIPNLLKRPASKNGERDFYIQYRKEQDKLFKQCSPEHSSYLYPEEYYLFVPLVAAYYLQSNNFFREADEWLRLLYNPLEYGLNTSNSIIYKNLDRYSEKNYSYRTTFKWLRDPFNPYLIARFRSTTFKRYVICQYVENLLNWAESEFVRDTTESVTHARELYELAEDILKSESETLKEMSTIGVKATQSAPLNLVSIRSLQDIYANLTSPEADLTRTEGALTKLNSDNELLAHSLDVLTISPEVLLASLFPLKIGDAGFYMPANSVLETLWWRINTNLEKIRTGCNYAGMRRSLPSYSSPADPLAVIQQSGGGTSLEESIPNEPPPTYRFSYLIERARYYVSIAEQLETLLLQSYEKFDAEHYTLLKAKQDLKVMEANLALQQLRVTEANDSCTLAQYQREKSELQYAHFDELIQTGLSEKENISMERFWDSYNWGIAAGFLEATMSGIEGGISGGTKGGFWGGLAGGILGGATGQTKANSEIRSKLSQGRAMQASFERREQEWKFQRDLANKDVVIGRQGETLATDRKNVVEQERNIAQLQSSFASEVVTFLETKFTNEDLWNWMSHVVKQFYRVHLNFATQTARMAQTALAFERQESLTFIASYYANTEKRDLLAAEQLLSDINRLDQHRLTTERRRKELTKVISLASVAPIEFQRIRQTGWMTFATLMDWFDRDFPGHYMRLIKSVSLTVVGLIPPNESIHVTLQNNGLSEVMVGPPWREYKTIQRQPESIAVTAASNGTGLFELRLDDPILLPFEGSGVQARWTLELPKGANRFDYSTLADIYFTIRYTALEDGGYRKRVLDQLGKYSNEKRAWLVPIQNMVSFSLRTFDSDAWYHLINPDSSSNAGQSVYAFEFELTPSDFPPNEEITRITRLNLALAQTDPTQLPILVEFWETQIKPKDNPPTCTKEEGYFWDRTQGNGGPLSLTTFNEHKPFGIWRLTFKVEQSQLDGNSAKPNLDWLTDALFVVTYEAEVEYGYAQTLGV